MTEIKTYPPAPDFVKNAHIDAATYQSMYEASINDPEAFLVANRANGWTWDQTVRPRSRIRHLMNMAT